MSGRLARSQRAGFVLAFFGFVTFGFTGAFGFVLNVESLSNPKRRHFIAFDIFGALVCVPQAIFFFLFSTFAFAYALENRDSLSLLISSGYPTYWLFWLGWSIYRRYTVWPEIWQNHAEVFRANLQRVNQTSVGLLPGADPLDVAVRRIEE